MAMHLLEGDVQDDRDARIAELEDELNVMRSDLRRAQQLARDAQANAVAGLVPLRRFLTPLHRALKEVFGELDAAGVPDSPATPSTSLSGPAATPDRVVEVWKAWKAKLPPAAGRVIDTLLLHGEMTNAQICVAAQMSKTTLRDAITKLNSVNLLTKNGGKYGLKAL